jgi:hypothetical protein
MKNRVAVLLIACCLVQAFAQREPKQRFSLEKAFNITVPLSRMSRQILHLKFDGKTPKLEVKLGNKTQLLEFDSFMLEAESHSSLLLDDFNFDGFTDIGIPTGIGYGGVNYFYEFYTFEHSSKTFKIMLNPDGNEWCNPQLEAKTKTIFTSCKSGPMWYGANYRFYRAQPYLYQSGEMAFLEGFGDDKDNDNLLWKVVSYNHNKQVLTSRCFEYETMQTPVRRIPKAKVFLYKQPRESAMTKNYIVQNDVISILELKDSDSGQWLYIVYHSRKLGWIKGWIRLG